MNTRSNWKKGDLGQIMATLLVVLPTLAFSVTFIISYWRVMQADYSIKLVANLAADYVNEQQDTTDIQSLSGYSAFKNVASNLCPANSNLTYTSGDNNGSKGIISITIKYTTPNTLAYLKNKKLATKIETYSFHDQNLTAVFTCQ
jgi:Flp pilus assembly protein TadG